MSADTIFALASGGGRSAVGVVRISGPQTRFVVETIAGKIPKARMATLARLRSGSGLALDQSLVLWFPGPQSFTGEDCAEFQVHGGRALVAAVLGAISAISGCRIAEPGEFSRRAFLNGKMDLAQAEGLADLIDADSECQRRQALRQLDGVLGVQTSRWRGQLLHMQAQIEAEIDFSDEGDVSAVSHFHLIDSASKLLSEITSALEQFKYSERIREGIYIVIAGSPNVGKSSLLNALTKRDAALVSSTAGTTRDIIEVSLLINGYLVIFVDTAGLRETDQEIEKLGIERAQKVLSQADLVLWLTTGEDEAKQADFSAPVLRIQTKRDLCGQQRPDTDLWISIKSGEGMGDLYAEIEHRIAVLPQESGLVTRIRHVEALTASAECLRRLIEAGSDTLPELLAEDLRAAAYSLGKITGHYGIEDILGELFSTFCIGK